MDKSNYAADYLAGDFDDAISKKHLPDTSFLSSNNADSAAFIRAVKVRLKSLGYLGKNNAIDKKVDRRFEYAVKRFQKSVGMKVVDGWVGKQTWQMLEFLCSFENKQNPEDWLGEWCDYCDVRIDEVQFEKNEAVLRSVYLRLYAYGFFPFDGDEFELNAKTEIDPHKNPAFASAIKRFLSFYKRLNKDVQMSKPEVSLPLLRLVFGYDLLVRELAGCDNFEQIQRNHKPVIDALARIELWLSGYDISPGSPERQYIKRKIGPPGKKRVRRVSKMSLALKEFYSSFPDAFVDAKHDEVSQALFRFLSESVSEPDQLDIEDDQFEAAMSQLLQDKKSEKQLLDQLSKITSTIWDGAKRLFKSLVRWLKRQAAFVSHFIANIARYVSLKARRVYGYVRSSLEIITEGLGFYINELGQPSEHGVVAFAQKKDFDQLVLVDARAQKKKLSQAYAERSLQSKLFSAASRIFRHLVNIARQVASLFVPAVGWLKALLSLRRMASSMVEIKTEIDLLNKHRYSF